MTSETPGPPDRPIPATQDDLRSLRRWLLVAGVWAAAATAIAVIALIQANKDDSEKLGKQTTSQIGQVQKDLNDRMDEIEQRLDDLAPAEDVARLDNRLKKVEDAASKTNDQLDSLNKDVDDLTSRVDDLEQDSGTDTTGTDTTETTP